MNLRRTLRAVFVFTLLVVLHYTIRPLLGWHVSIDFLVVGVLLMAVRVRPGTAALLGFLTGIIADSLTPATFGAGALAMTGIGFAASWLKAVFFADNIVLHAFFFFIGKWVFDAIFLFAARSSGLGEYATQLFLWSPLSAAVTAVAGVVMLLIFRALLEPQAA